MTVKEIYFGLDNHHMWLRKKDTDWHAPSVVMARAFTVKNHVIYQDEWDKIHGVYSGTNAWPEGQSSSRTQNWSGWRETSEEWLPTRQMERDWQEAHAAQQAASASSSAPNAPQVDQWPDLPPGEHHGAT